MIVSKPKPWPEVLEFVKKDKALFILGCNGCAQSSGTGGQAQVKEAEQKLKEAGKKVTGSMVVDFLCQKALVKSRMRPRAGQLETADAILVMTCGLGVQTVASVAGKVCHPACDTVYMGGSRGEWVGEARCLECGQCVLEYTGGICPLTACSKSLLSGACGGASEGKCELDREKDCGWELIYNRLKSINRLANLKQMIEPNNFNKRMTYGENISSPRWALERRG